MARTQAGPNAAKKKPRALAQSPKRQGKRAKRAKKERNGGKRERKIYPSKTTTSKWRQLGKGTLETTESALKQASQLCLEDVGVGAKEIVSRVQERLLERLKATKGPASIRQNSSRIQGLNVAELVEIGEEEIERLDEHVENKRLHLNERQETDDDHARLQRLKQIVIKTRLPVASAEDNLKDILVNALPAN